MASSRTHQNASRTSQVQKKHLLTTEAGSYFLSLTDNTSSTYYKLHSACVEM